MQDKNKIEKEKKLHPLYKKGLVQIAVLFCSFPPRSSRADLYERLVLRENKNVFSLVLHYLLARTYFFGFDPASATPGKRGLVDFTAQGDVAQKCDIRFPTRLKLILKKDPATADDLGAYFQENESLRAMTFRKFELIDEQGVLHTEEEIIKSRLFHSKDFDYINEHTFKKTV